VFIDASAVLAILLNEADAAEIVAKIQKTRKRYVSAVVRFESTVRLVSLKSGAGKPLGRSDFDQASQIVDRFIQSYRATLLPIGAEESRLSLQAYRQFGKGTGHRAQLNMGDCFSYACAKSRSLPLLCKGNDFVHTDLDLA